MLIQYTNIQHCIYANAKSMKSLVFTCSQSWRDNWEINLYVPPSILSCMVLYPQLNLHSYAPRFWKCSFLLRLTRTWNLSLSCLKLKVIETSVGIEIELEKIISKLLAVFWRIWHSIHIWVRFFFYSWKTIKMCL